MPENGLTFYSFITFFETLRDSLQRESEKQMNDEPDVFFLQRSRLLNNIASSIDDALYEIVDVDEDDPAEDAQDC